MALITCSIVLYRHTPPQLSLLLSTILQCSLVKRIYLVDNSPTDKLKYLANDDRIQYIFNNKNIGYGAGHNIAIRLGISSEVDYHVVLNPDVMFNTGTLDTLANYMDANLAVGHIMPKLIYPNGNIQYVCRLLPTPFDLIGRRFLPSFITKKRNQHFEMCASGYNKVMNVPYLNGSFMFFRLKAVKEVGVFDERFFMYPEDIDITRRIYKHYKTIFFPYATATHSYERGSYKSTKLLFIHIVNMIKYFNKWGWFFDKERKAINKEIIKQYKD